MASHSLQDCSPQRLCEVKPLVFFGQVAIFAMVRGESCRANRRLEGSCGSIQKNAIHELPFKPSIQKYFGCHQASAENSSFAHLHWLLLFCASMWSLKYWNMVTQNHCLGPLSLPNTQHSASTGRQCILTHRYNLLLANLCLVHADSSSLQRTDNSTAGPDQLHHQHPHHAGEAPNLLTSKTLSQDPKPVPLQITKAQSWL